MNSENRRSGILEIALVAVMVALCVLIIFGLTSMQKTARIINYTGLVRGTTQKLVKLELMDQPSPDTEDRLDSWILELKTGEGDSDLAVIKDKDYQSKLRRLYDFWLTIKENIQDVRDGGDKRVLLENSDEYFILADELVSSAEHYSRIQSMWLKALIYVLLILTVCLAFELGLRTYQSVKLKKRIKELDTIAFEDAVTNIPNRTRCDELTHNHTAKESCANHGAVMFDLNNLKETNDRYGHRAGDVLLANFAHMLSETAAGHCFVGRWGGDEFIAVFEDAGNAAIDRFLEDMTAKATEFNQKRTLIKIDYASGVCLASECSPASLEHMIEIADARMYKQKAIMKKKRNQN